MANLGKGLGGAAAGAATGAAVGSVVPGIGTAIGAVGGAIIGGVSGLLGGGNDDTQQNPSVSTQVLGNQFRGTVNKDAIIAQSLLAQKPELGSLENAMAWYRGRRAVLDSGASLNSDDDARAIASAQMAAEQAKGEFDLNMANAEQQRAIFGTQGSAFLQSKPTDLISTPLDSIERAKSQIPLTEAGIAQLGMEAGLTPGTPEEQARQQRVQAQFREAALEPVRAEIASQLATAQRGAASRGMAYDPSLARLGIQQTALSSQRIGLEQSLQNEARRREAINLLPQMVSAQQQQVLTPAQYLTQVQQAQAQTGAQQTQLGLGGFTAAGQLAAQERSSDVAQATANSKLAQDQALADRLAGNQQTAGILSAAGTLAALGGQAAQAGNTESWKGSMTNLVPEVPELKTPELGSSRKNSTGLNLLGSK